MPNSVKHLAIIALFISLFACEKEEFKTQGQLIGENLQQLANENNIKLCNVYVWNISGSRYNLTHPKFEFTIEKGFLITKADTLNLERIFNWQVSNKNGEKILELYFK